MIRAGLVHCRAPLVGDGRTGRPQIAYVTSDEAFRTPFARSYRVLEELPYREKQLRAALQGARHRPADHQEASAWTSCPNSCVDVSTRTAREATPR